MEIWRGNLTVVERISMILLELLEFLLEFCLGNSYVFFECSNHFNFESWICRLFEFSNGICFYWTKIMEYGQFSEDRVLCCGNEACTASIISFERLLFSDGSSECFYCYLFAKKKGILSFLHIFLIAKVNFLWKDCLCLFLNMWKIYFFFVFL